jgi:hypothetical protein
LPPGNTTGTPAHTESYRQQGDREPNNKYTDDRGRQKCRGSDNCQHEYKRPDRSIRCGMPPAAACRQYVREDNLRNTSAQMSSQLRIQRLPAIVDGLGESTSGKMSNFCCFPGKAGGTPIMV